MEYSQKQREALQFSQAGKASRKQGSREAGHYDRESVRWIGTLWAFSSSNASDRREDQEGEAGGGKHFPLDGVRSHQARDARMEEEGRPEEGARLRTKKDRFSLRDQLENQQIKLRAGESPEESELERRVTVSDSQWGSYNH